MKKHLFALLLAVTSPLFALAQEPAIRPDIEELFTAMRMEYTMQNAMEQVQKMVPQMTSNMVGKMTNVPADTAEKTKALQEKIFALIQEEMNWAKFKPSIAAVYAESLTPEEVKGITAFYKSPAGQAFLDKQPVIMQKCMGMQQQMMMDMMPKIQALMKSEMGADSKPTPQPAQ